jgi:hypothetical protein
LTSDTGSSGTETPEGAPPQTRSIYSTINAALRVEVFDETPEADYEVSIRGFLRNAGIGHLYEERIRPTLEAGDSAIFVGVLDRVWPPWGLGAHTVLALCQAHLVGDKRYGISPVFANPAHLTNIGLQAAVLKEAIDYIAAKEGEINYLVRDGARYSRSFLEAVGFSRVNEFFQDHIGRYAIYRTSAAALTSRLGLTSSSADLLAEDIPAENYSTIVSYVNVIHLASNSFTREIIAIDGGLDDSLPPATIKGSMEDPWQFGQEGVLRER